MVYNAYEHSDNGFSRCCGSKSGRYTLNIGTVFHLCGYLHEYHVDPTKITDKQNWREFLFIELYLGSKLLRTVRTIVLSDNTLAWVFQFIWMLGTNVPGTWTGINKFARAPLARIGSVVQVVLALVRFQTFLSTITNNWIYTKWGWEVSVSYPREKNVFTHNAFWRKFFRMFFCQVCF